MTTTTTRTLAERAKVAEARAVKATETAERLSERATLESEVVAALNYVGTVAAQCATQDADGTVYHAELITAIAAALRVKAPVASITKVIADRVGYKVNGLTRVLFLAKVEVGDKKPVQDVPAIDGEPCYSPIAWLTAKHAEPATLHSTHLLFAKACRDTPDEPTRADAIAQLLKAKASYVSGHNDVTGEPIPAKVSMADPLDCCEVLIAIMRSDMGLLLPSEERASVVAMFSRALGRLLEPTPETTPTIGNFEAAERIASPFPEAATV